MLVRTANNMQSGKQTDLILLDFSKAFDKVAHEKLLFETTLLWYKGEQEHTKLDKRFS